MLFGISFNTLVFSKEKSWYVLIYMRSHTRYTYENLAERLTWFDYVDKFMWVAVYIKVH